MARPTLLVRPFASALCPSAEAAALETTVHALLACHDLTALPLPRDGSRPPAAGEAALILTGGTEREALAWLEPHADPLLVLAHASHNSLPAALEIVARLRQLGRRARLFLVREDGSDRGPLARCLRALGAREALRGRKLGLVGGASEWLVASEVDAASLAERFGIELVTVPMAELDADFEQASDADARAVAASWRSGADEVVEPTEPDLVRAARLAVALRALAGRHGLSACTVRCFDLLGTKRTTGCLALAQLTDEGVVGGCEGDVPTTLTMMWLAALTGELPFMANPQDVSLDERTLWLAHCTVARGLGARYRLRSHFESSIGVGIEADIGAPTATIARIGGRSLERVTVVEGDRIAGEPSPMRCRTQVALRLGVQSRPWLERLLAEPLGNHLVLVPGRHEALVREYVGLNRGLRVTE